MNAGRARPHRFTRAMRLVRGKDFQRVYREGARAKGEHVTVVVAPTAAADPEARRLGLSIGRRVWRQAVERNRLRRLYREAFRLERERLPEGIDLVVVGSTPRAEPELAGAREDLVRLAWKAWRRERERRARREPRP